MILVILSVVFFAFFVLVGSVGIATFHCLKSALDIDFDFDFDFDFVVDYIFLPALVW